MELLREAVLRISRVGVLAVSQTKSHLTYWTEIQATAQALKVIPQRQDVAGPDEIDDAFVRLSKGHPQGVIVLPHAITIERRMQIAERATKIGCRRYTRSAYLWRLAVSCPTGQISQPCTSAPPSM